MLNYYVHCNHCSRYIILSVRTSAPVPWSGGRVRSDFPVNRAGDFRHTFLWHSVCPMTNNVLGRAQRKGEVFSPSLCPAPLLCIAVYVCILKTSIIILCIVQVWGGQSCNCLTPELESNRSTSANKSQLVGQPNFLSCVLDFLRSRHLLNASI